MHNICSSDMGGYRALTQPMAQHVDSTTRIVNYIPVKADAPAC